jgi:hypothetical protein
MICCGTGEESLSGQHPSWVLLHLATLGQRASLRNEFDRQGSLPSIHRAEGSWPLLAYRRRCAGSTLTLFNQKESQHARRAEINETLAVPCS